MKPYWSDDTTTLYLGKAEHVLPTLPDASVDAIVTDPPYELRFMGRTWDASGVAYNTDMWAECLRVLKPGGHLLAFGGTRTYHRMVCAVEDAGFEIRDSIHWIYGSGFPKSVNVAKEIDKRRFGSADVAAFKAALAEAVAVSGKTRQQINAECGFTMRFDVSYDRDPVGWGCSLPTATQYEVICRVLGVEGDSTALSALREWPRVRLERLYKVVGHDERLNAPNGIVSAGRASRPVRREITAPGTAAAARWDGWGTALKPGHEPIVLARRPLAGAVAANVLEHGTGALNIDGCRVGWDRASLAKDTARRQQPRHDMTGGRLLGGSSGDYEGERTSPAGRWPTNMVFSHLPECGPDDTTPCAEGCAVAELDRQSGTLRARGNRAPTIAQKGATGVFGEYNGAMLDHGPGDSGGASRFYPAFRYQAKAPAAERPKVDGVAHETVKPLALMQWLVRLITPPGGVVLDPFLGSGTTAEACALEGFRCVGIEEAAKYMPLIRARLAKPMQPDLGFDGQPTT